MIYEGETRSRKHYKYIPFYASILSATQVRNFKIHGLSYAKNRKKRHFFSFWK